ncbi:hypothetical protein [Chitinophaga niabensis]|uniref:Uncharacterized protein n=1 Tax=Chitinophaga niabensis TaxID=536979 RepID=A0A1N6E2V8_9BACT|nr:hypothetical protein [Chitinophaga niabensis]SIN77346.1 hypothetical protein SAMN04488055_1262 [Chitinophaga niabensis]
MQRFLLILFICCAISCRKYNIDSLSQSSSGDGPTYHFADARVVRVEGCAEKPVLLEFLGGSWRSVFSMSFGFNANDEYWSFNVPDSLKAPGQELEVYFRPIHAKYWKVCSYIPPPNQIEFRTIKPALHWSEFEVIGITMDCWKAIVKIDPSFKYTYGTTVLLVNLPDSLKVIGKRAGGYLRYASMTERVKCNSAVNFKQVMINGLIAW